MRRPRRSALRSLAVAAGFLACFASATVAWADPETARRHFDAGKQARDEGDCARAIPSFEQSIAAERSIGAYYNLGFCHEQLGHRQEAYDAYTHARDMASARKDDRLREISGALGGLLDTPHVRLILPKMPPGLQITVDGRAVPPQFLATETYVFTEGGKTHVVVAKAPGYAERRETITDPKEPKTIELQPADVATSAPPPPPAEQPSWTWQHWTGIGVAVAGAAAFTIGAVVGVSYLNDENRLLKQFEQLDAECNAAGSKCGDSLRANRERVRLEYEANEDEAKAKRPLIFTALIGGALLIGGGVFLYFTAPRVDDAEKARQARSKPTSTMRLAPALGPGFQGMTAVGTF